VISTLAQFRLCNRLHATRALDIVSHGSRELDGTFSPLTGFSPGVEPDLDDSAKASIIMSLTGNSGRSDIIVNRFSSAHGLRTYLGERNPSLSANCNALSSLLVDPMEYNDKSPTIKNVLAFIYDSCMGCEGEIKDKWVSTWDISYNSLLMSCRMFRRIIR
jgi:hypothetical protein